MTKRLNEWLATFDLCPVLTIPRDDLDFVNRPTHLDIVVGRIRKKLAGKEDVVFPANGDRAARPLAFAAKL